MNYEDEAIRFLATEENLPMALEIANIVEGLKERLHREFWQGLHASLRQKLARSDKASRWRIKLNQGRIDKYKSDYFTCTIVPSYIEEKQHYFSLSLQQGDFASGYPLYYGITRSDPNNQSKESGLEKIKRLSASIQREEFQDDGKWWFGIKETDYSCNRQAFLLRMANEKEVFIDEMAEMIWQLFESQHALLEDVNGALARVF